MIPESIEYVVDGFRNIKMSRKDANLFTVEFVGDNGDRSFISLDTSQMLELSDNLSTMVFGDGEE